MFVKDFAWALFKIGIGIAVLTFFLSVSLFFPYRTELNSVTNDLLLRVVNDNYITESEILAVQNQLKTNDNFLGKKTLTPNDDLTGLTMGTPRTPIIHVNWVTGSGRKNIVMSDSFDPDALVSESSIPNRNRQVEVIVETDMLVEVSVFGKIFKAYIPVTIKQTGVTIKYYRW